MHYTEDELRSLFQQKFSRKAWTGFLQNFMEGARLRSVPEEFHTPSDNEKGFFIGEYNTSDHYRIGLFQFDVKAASIARKRVGLRNLVKSLINPNWGEFDAAFAVFASDSDWRLSFICDIKEEKTAPKRFTYVFGEKSLLYRTPVSRLSAIQGSVTFASLKEAFSVEKVSKDFFREYREIYADFVQYLTGNRYVKKTQGSGYELKSFPGEPQNKAFYEALGKDDKRARDFVKKMMGRITFLYFLQQKGWMCGDKNYMFHLFESSVDKDFYLKKVLVPLFFGVLNTKPEERKAVFGKHKWNDELRKAWVTIPYLNGGLFEPDDEDKVVDACSTHIFRQNDFEELFEFYSHYNFTIDENDPSDAEVGVDPEMLGKIFESLLEDNKDKGAYYTPKEIVQYMCQESLVAYLVTKTGIEEGRLREFVKEPEDNKDGFMEDERYKILDGVLNVKICDPAIGSGAFPIGLLNELVRCKEAIYGDKKGRADIKREIIRDNIYGVDIEKGAVDIARLRFWLSLVVDEDTPSPLPNLDYKIMQGNSLMEWYNGTDLSKLTDMAASDDLFGGGRAEELKKDLAKLLKRYFGEFDHDKKFALKEAIKATITEILDIAGVEIPDGIDIAENSQFFLWHTWYNEVFANNGGFDICLGNPPYIFARNSNDKGMTKLDKQYYYCHYSLAKYQINLYHLFVELGSSILKTDGIFAYIIPNNWMTINTNKYLREFVLHKTNPLVVNFTKQVFETADVDSSIVIYNNKECSNSVMSLYEASAPSVIDEICKVPCSSFLNGKDCLINIELFRDSTNIDVLLMIEKASRPLSPFYASVKAGLQAYEVGKGNPILTPEMKKQRIYHTCNPVGSDYYKYIDGVDVKRYQITWERGEYLKYGNNLAAPRVWKLFSTPRILVRQIPSQPPYCICAAFTDEVLLNDRNSMNIVDIQCKPLFLLGVLNSRVVSFWFQHKFGKMQRGLFPQFKVNELGIFPVPNADEEQQELVSSLVNKIVDGYKNGQNTTLIDKELDNIIFELFKLPQSIKPIIGLE